VFGQVGNSFGQPPKVKDLKKPANQPTQNPSAQNQKKPESLNENKLNQGTSKGFAASTQGLEGDLVIEREFCLMILGKNP